MTNKKRANKLAKITVASAIALSALAQPLGNVITVKATEAPVTTKAERQLLQSTASLPVSIQNSQFTSTSNSIPGWTGVSITNGYYIGSRLSYTPVALSSKNSDGFFALDSKKDSQIRPNGEGGFQVKVNLYKEAGLQQEIDTIPGVKYTLGYTVTTQDNGLSYDYMTGSEKPLFRAYVESSESKFQNMLGEIRYGLPIDNTTKTYSSDDTDTIEYSFVATSLKTKVTLGIAHGRATDPDWVAPANLYTLATIGNISLNGSASVNIAAPTINTVTDNDTIVTGTGEADQKVRVVLSDGSSKTGIVEANGKYSIEIPKQAKDKVIKVMLYDGEGNVSPEASTTVISDVVAPPTINDVTSDDITVKGTGVNGATVTLTIGSATYTGTVSGGEYSITIPKQSAGTVISAKESLNNRTSTAVSTTVTQGTVAAPTINTVTSDDITVTGTGIKGAVVTLTIAGHNYTGLVDANGAYSITIVKQPVGTTVTAKQEINTKSSANATTTVTQGTVAAPTINTVTTDDTTITGTGVKGAVVKVTIGGTDYTGLVDNDGKYSIVIPKQAFGTAIVANQTLNTKTSTNTQASVAQGTVAAPTISSVTTDDATVKGTGITGAVVTITIGSNTYTGTVTGGNYSITIPKQAVGTVISAKQTVNSKPSASVTTTVTQGVVTAPTVNTVTTDDTTVTGTGMKGAVVKLTIGGTNYTGLVDNDGKYSIAIPKQAFGTAIVANQTLNTKTSTDTQASVAQGTVAAPTISAVTTDDATVKGTGITGAVVTITIGSNTYTGTVTGGNYSITIPKQAAGTVISAKQTVNSKPSASVTTTVVSTQTTLTANDFTIGADNYIKGSYSGSSVSKLAIEVNGVVQQKITATGSPYQYYAKGKVTAGTDQVYVISYNANGDQLKRVKVNVKTLTSGTITPATFYIGTDNYVTGTLTGDVSKFSLTINGVETAKINVTTAPTFRYYANNLIRNLTDVVTVNGYDSAGKLLDSTTLTVDKQRGNQGSIATVAPFTLGKDSYVTGTYTGDIAKVELQVNDTTLQRITVPADGTIKYYAKGKINALTDVVKLIGYDSTGVAVSTKVVSVTGANGSITVNPYVIGTDSYVKGTFSGNVAKVSLTVNGEKKTTIPVPASGANYQYYAKSLITEATDVVVVTAYNSAGGVLDTKAVSVSKR
ncbi:immunoglobulin-like domain-containing protein [Listeria booriae]|uniref:immunoglobulin-like domain-containing protein n=1 Tax=Listeria booriae TaxID=1552123 RepID=UPI0016279E78|nr:immunoglobulin-like domain-containing protein [Listeria booriae]MBC1273049.1 hypothetical protein [Listeria booriae]